MSWKKIHLLVFLASLLMVSGCMDTPQSAECPSGLVCPPGSVCAANQDTCISDPCGNGIIDDGEMCDHGNIIANDGCSADCKSDETCGNGVLDGQKGEVCDDGNETSGDGCSADCKFEACGNGIIDAGEVCDDSNSTSGDGCSADCTSRETCGNGAIDAGEVCDDANQTAGDGCSADCKSDETCGNSHLDPGEDCDEGGVNTVTCDADCTAASCGDEFVNPEAGELCDDRGASDTCDANCRLVSCGNGIVDPGELCDDGGDSATCDADCTPALCSDGYQNIAAGEQCDTRGESTTCDPDCTLAQCGDGRLNRTAGEICDAGGQLTDTCDDDCTLPACGDGLWNPIAGEECDDGNSENIDECTAVCEAADCTDDFQNSDEIDVDCGGHCGPHSCEPLQSCSTSEDCTGVCVRGTCVPDVSHLATGGFHTCALLNTGAVRCWGSGSHGRLGYGNTNNIGDNETPSTSGDVNVAGTVIQIAAGLEHTCALLDTGAVRCWGNGAAGRLGYGNINTIGDNEVPAFAAPVNVGGTVIQLAAGSAHTCALLDTGGVRCWGAGQDGQLGYGNTNNIGDNEVPASAGNVNVGGTVIQLTAGHAHTCALLDTGGVRCWGAGAHGRLGYGNTNNIGDNETPASVGNVNVGGDVIQLSAGAAHTCALLDTGTARCWGAGSYGRLGYGNTNNIGDNEVPASAGNIDVGGTVIQVAAGYAHACALLDTGTVRCWGYGAHGRLGYGNTNHIGDNEAPASTGNVNVGGSVIQLAVSVMAIAGADGIVRGGAHTCVVLDTGAVRCWGEGAGGRLGYGNTNNIGDNEHPAATGNVSIGGSLLSSVTGLEATGDLLDASDAQCWSDGVSGQFDRITTSYIAE